jgi:hypothetical protein
MKDTRRFAVEVMNRAGLAFDAPDVARVGKVMEQLEADLATWLDQELHGGVLVADVIAAIRSGAWRESGIGPP